MAMSPVSQYRNSSLRRSPSNQVATGCLAFLLIATFVALPSSAMAYPWWSGWDSYAECKDYYTKNPATADCYWSGGTTHCHPAYTPEQMCASKKAEEDEKLRQQEEMRRIIVLSCQAEAVTYSQFAACVALATSR